MQHFQGVCSVARTIFEVRVDVELLSRGSEREIEQFHAFPSIERFRAAERLLVTVERTKTPDAQLPLLITGARALVTEERRIELQNLIRRLWPNRDPLNPRTWPKHWSGIDDLSSRCKSLGPHIQVEYAQCYSALSWQVHAGSTGYAGKEGVFFHWLCAWSYGQARVWLTEALRLVAPRFHLNKAIEHFGRNTLTLMNLSDVTGEIAAAARRADDNRA